MIRPISRLPAAERRWLGLVVPCAHTPAPASCPAGTERGFAQGTLLPGNLERGTPPLRRHGGGGGSFRSLFRHNQARTHTSWPVNILRLGLAPAGQFCRPALPVRANSYTALHYPPYRNLQARPALEPPIAKHSWVVRAARIGPQAIARLTATSRPSRTVISKTRRWSFSNLVIPENTAWLLHCRVS